MDIWFETLVSLSRNRPDLPHVWRCLLEDLQSHCVMELAYSFPQAAVMYLLLLSSRATGCFCRSRSICDLVVELNQDPGVRGAKKYKTDMKFQAE